MTDDITFRRMTVDDMGLAKEVFRGDTSGEVAAPNPTWLQYVTTTANAFCVLHFLDNAPIAITQFDIEESKR